MGIDNDGYYTFRDVLGYGAKWNFVLGDRGRGKSYGAKKMLLGAEGKFMCLYRNIADLELAVADWLDPMYNEGYEPEQFEWEKQGRAGGVNLLMNGTVKGYFRSVSQVNHIKQEHFPDDLNWIFFDEFIPMVYRKLGGTGMNEGECVRIIYKTIDHDTAHSRESKGLKPLRVLLVANPFTWDNPILSYFHVLPKKVGIFRVGPDIVCEMLEPYVAAKTGKQTIDDFLGDEVNKTQGWMDENSFVETFPKGLVPFESHRYGDNYYGFYRSKQGGAKVYCRSVSRHLNVLRNYGTLDGLKEGELSVDSKHRGKCRRQTLLEYVMLGGVYFENMNTKFDLIRDLQG